MKFAKELDQELVPEWRAKYLDYKTGKKKVKAISRALQKSHRSPSHPSLRRATTTAHGDHPAPPVGPSRRSSSVHQSDKRLEATEPLDPPATPARSSGGAVSTPGRRNERQPLRIPGSRFSTAAGSYGSIIATPPQHAPSSDVASLELPDPAIAPDEQRNSPERTLHRQATPAPPSPVMSRSLSTKTVPTEARRRRSSTKTSIAAKADKRNTVSGPSSTNRTSQLLKRVFSHPDWESPEKRAGAPSSELDRRKDEFYEFLDDQFDKIESFYQQKEEEATARLQVLRQQLHIMRDQRIQEILGVRKARPEDKGEQKSNGFAGINGDRIKGALGGFRIGKNSKALADLGTPALPPQDHETVVNRRDFSRRTAERTADSPNSEVSYRSAKRKLKHALQEFYRGVELLKGYAYLNRIAFRKINKKYDKVTSERPTMRYMSEKVNKAWFVQSEVTENLMAATEDLYARYFERGNRKIAVSKLRRTVRKSGDYSNNTFRSGLLLMAGILFGIQALVYSGHLLNDHDPVVQQHTNYLMQIYGGYFLAVFHTLLFCIDCYVWTKSKINYTFIFEYDSRTALDWRQLSELPCLFMFLLGLIMWLNFLLKNNVMFEYWPVVLVGLTMVILLLPMRVLYHRSRKWWAYSNWRLLLAGVYPVEFRDFFLGDMYCSQTYAMGNISLFFCLYARHWSSGATQCTSSHSRLLGFFQTLPSILRALQCLRRYGDTRNVFPHLLNFGKYLFGVLYYATLSMYRIDRADRFQAVFITFALLNAVYTSVWDIAMDWSLGNPYTKHPLLREALAFRRAWVYYAAIVVDIVIRFNWIFYALFAHDVGHSAVLSFAVSFSEICRRGVWSIFRVENEHCTNVLLFRASRDIPLPYEVGPSHHPPERPTEDVQLQDQYPATPAPAGDVEGGTPPTPGASLRTILASAHTQDFQRRKPVGALSPGLGANAEESTPDDTSDEEDDDTPVDPAGPYASTEEAIAEELPYKDSDIE